MRLHFKGTWHSQQLEKIRRIHASAVSEGILEREKKKKKSDSEEIKMSNMGTKTDPDVEEEGKTSCTPAD